MIKVYTVVVTYNRCKLLKECIEALLHQTYPTHIIVVNNASTDGTKALLKEYENNAQINCLNLEQNLGGAGGFYEGMKYARELKADYVWLMDDDAEPEIECLEILIKEIQKRPNYAAYAPQVQIGTKKSSTLSTYGHRGVFDYVHTLPAFQQRAPLEAFKQDTYEIDMASFVGILVPRSSYEAVGLPKKEFFIHHDDTEYSLRLASLGKILLINRAKIYHKEERQEEKIEKCFLWWRKKRVRFERLWLKFYGLRNSIWLAKKYSKSPWVYWQIARVYGELVKDIIFYDDNKWLRLKFATYSVLDGLKGNFDNSKAKRVLHV